MFPATKPYLLASDWSAAVYLRGTHFPPLLGWPEMCDRWVNRYTQCRYLSRRVTWKIFFPPANVCWESCFDTSLPDAAKSLGFNTPAIQQTRANLTDATIIGEVRRLSGAERVVANGEEAESKIHSTRREVGSVEASLTKVVSTDKTLKYLIGKVENLHL